MLLVVRYEIIQGVSSVSRQTFHSILYEPATCGIYNLNVWEHLFHCCYLVPPFPEV